MTEKQHSVWDKDYNRYALYAVLVIVYIVGFSIASHYSNDRDHNHPTTQQVSETGGKK